MENMDYQRSKDLLEKISNFQGHNGKKLHIHNYVYKLSGLLAKVPGWMGSKESIRFRGFSGRFSHDT
jgi:hypothetical protein